MLITIAETPSFQRAVRSLLSEQVHEHLDNLSKQERNELAKAVSALVIYWRSRNGQGIH
jgi:hypothetical protein